jgi:hypothetical protein
VSALSRTKRILSTQCSGFAADVVTTEMRCLLLGVAILFSGLCLRRQQSRFSAGVEWGIVYYALRLEFRRSGPVNPRGIVNVLEENKCNTILYVAVFFF